VKALGVSSPGPAWMHLGERDAPASRAANQRQLRDEAKAPLKERQTPCLSATGAAG